MLTTPALAEEQPGPIGDGFTIATADLELGHARDRASLLRRVESASRQFCRSVVPRPRREACIEESLARAAATSAPVVRQAIAEARAERPSREFAALPRTITVNAPLAFGDLDLDTPAGMAELHRRATRVALDMCRVPFVPSGPPAGRVERRCFNQAMANARIQVAQAVAARRGDARAQRAALAR
jgi:UrcA family protein